MTVHHQHAVALCLGSLDIAILLFFVGSIQVYQVTVFICLLGSDECLVLLIGEILTLYVLQQSEVLGSVVEILL